MQKWQNLVYHSTFNYKNWSKSIYLLLVLGFGVFASQTCYATHIRAGEILVRKLPGSAFSFKITLVVYTDSEASIQDMFADLYFGDGNFQQSPRLSQTLIPGKKVHVNIYEFEHIYNTPGNYRMYYIGQNRNVGVRNMASSVNTGFYVETQISISPFVGINNSPILTNPPVDDAALGRIFTHNPAAYDPDGDSLSYAIIPSREFSTTQQTAVNVAGYQDPALFAGGTNLANNAPASLTINVRTGLLTWDKPNNFVGEYNFAIQVNEWRRGRLIGYVVRDMQVNVMDSRNWPPLLTIPRDTCIMANTLLSKTISAIDTNTGDRINLSSYGGVYQLNLPNQRATFTTSNPQNSPVSGLFTWATNCFSVRRQTYEVTFKAEDIPTRPPTLAVLATWRIQVVGPPPLLNTAIPLNNTITLAWNPYFCANAEFIDVYRKEGNSNFVPGGCRVGLPPETGFVRIAQLPISATSFVDQNQNLPFKKGTSYCYRLVARFAEPAGGLSYASNEICTAMRLDAPVLTKVSVLTTDRQNGSIRVEWSRPLELNAAVFPGPYRYQLMRSSLGRNVFVAVSSQTSLLDTVFTDQNLNTQDSVYNYKLEFYYAGGQTLKEISEPASSVRLILQSTPRSIGLNWQTQTPWNNSGFQHYIWRKEESQNNFVKIDSILATAGRFIYTDIGQYNNIPLQTTKRYCYYITTQGSYSNPFIKPILANNSQQNCTSLTDTIAPCLPVLYMDTLICPGCEQARLWAPPFQNKLHWKPDTSLGCDTSVAAYRLYFAPTRSDSLKLLATTSDTVFNHQNLRSYAGCYQVRAVDVFGNTSGFSNKVCKQNCLYFELPNIITPNGDETNETFTPICLSPVSIEEVRFKVYNRWGKLVYSSSGNPLINWKGNNSNGKPLSSGVYYYQAEVVFISVERKQATETFKGWVQILR